MPLQLNPDKPPQIVTLRCPVVFIAGDIKGMCTLHTATPPDIMHSLQHGLYMYVLAVFLSFFTDAAKAHLDSLIQRAAAQLRQTARRDYPRANFIKGFTNLTLIRASKRSGALFILCLILSQKKNSLHFSRMFGGAAGDNMARISKGEKVIAAFVTMFETLLCFEQWCKQDTFWWRDDQRSAREAHCKIVELLDLVKRTAPREEGNGYKFPKFHECLHFVWYINMHGTLMNCYNGPMENHHIKDSKNIARKTRMSSHETFDEKCALRLAERDVIDAAVRNFVRCDGPNSWEVPKSVQNAINGRKGLDAIYAEAMEDANEKEAEMKRIHARSEDWEDVEPEFVEDGEPTNVDAVEGEEDSCGGHSTKFYIRKALPPHTRFELCRWAREVETGKPPPEIVIGVSQHFLSAVVLQYLDASSVHPKSGALLPNNRYHCIAFVSEYVRKKTRFRSHFNYKSKGTCQDWATVTWDEYPLNAVVPAQILMLVQVIPRNNPTKVEFEAVIHSSTALVPQHSRTLLTRRFRLFLERKRCRNTNSSGKGVGGKYEKVVPWYNFVLAKSLSGHCLVSCPTGASTNEVLEFDERVPMLYVTPMDEWADQFYKICR